MVGVPRDVLLVLRSDRLVSRGIDRERAWCRRLRQEGWWAQRAPGSLGSVDVIAVRPRLLGNSQYGCDVHMYEVKSTADGPYKSFGPRDREALRFEAQRAGAECFLVWWPPRSDPKVIPERDWPDDRKLKLAA